MRRYDVKMSGNASNTRRVSSQELAKHTATAVITDVVASTIIPSRIPVP